MSKKHSRILLLCLILAVTVFIFSNSLKGSAASTRDSNFFIRIIESLFGETDLDLHFLVRKAAHLAEFAVLGLLVACIMYQLKFPVARFGYGLFYVLAVAVTDEFIQIFTGRTSSVIDILIDFAGAFIGIGLVILSRQIKRIS